MIEHNASPGWAGAQHSQSPPKAERAAVMYQYNPIMFGRRLKSKPGRPNRAGILAKKRPQAGGA